jgi:riboflavin kinase / FMN adenylyltransferase
MEIIDANSLNDSLKEKTAIALGMFDGVHMGHQKVISHAKEYAKKHNLKLGVITLKSHPKEITHRNLKTKTTPKLITNLKTRLKIFESIGVDFALVIDFDQDFMNTSAEDYLNTYLKDKLNAAFISVGFDHHFGKQRSGNIELLKTWTKENNVELKVQEAFQIVDTIVSSSLIRQLLEHSQIKEVNEYLGYDFRYISEVIHGERKGRELGFPTANLRIDPKVQLPANGVYKGYCSIDDPKHTEKIFNVAINLGYRPSVNSDKELSLEVHILGFDDDIYGKNLDLRFIEKIRDEKKFDSLEALKLQITEDISFVSNETKLMINSPHSRSTTP